MGDKATKERESKLKGLTGVAVAPIMLSYLEKPFCDMYLAAFGTGRAPGDEPVYQLGTFMDSGRGLGIAIMAMLMCAWVWPAIRYTRRPKPEYLRQMRGRFLNIYRDAAIMLAAAFAARLGLLFLKGPVPAGLFFTEALPVMAIALFVQASALLVYIDFNFALNQDFMALLFTREELFAPRQGLYVPLYIKMGGLISAFAVLPFLLLTAALELKLPAGDFSGPATTMMFASFITLVIGMRFLFNGIQKPLDGLIDKMRRVSDGDYDVKTRVYFSDEVARLKAGFNEMVDGLKERAELQDTFGRYLSIEIARELINNKKVNLGGEDIEAAVMFCDIHNFTPLSEKMSAAEVVSFLNEYFRYVTVPITAHHGVINKFIGDAVMAVYTPLLGSTDYAADAVRAAADMRRALAEFNASGKAPLQVSFGVGVHCGRLVAGNIGTFSRLEYTFIGDTVNIASRLESKAKELGVDILVSAAVAEKARSAIGGGVALEPLGKVALKGKTSQVEVCRLA